MRARDNPFRSERILQVRYQFVGELDWERLLERLDAFNCRGAIVGPKGTGKTTLQEDLADRLQAKGKRIHWLRFRRENRDTARRQIAALRRRGRANELLFVDGAEQLSWFWWHRLQQVASGCSGLVINTHTPGRLPTLIECHTTPALLQDVVSQLVPAAGTPSTDELDDLFTQHAGNLRGCLRELYDCWADR